MIRRSLFCAVLFLIGSVALAGVGIAQILPRSIQQELARNNLSEAEARSLADRLGIDLNDPVQAAQRARELGVSESTIQRLLRAVASPTDGRSAVSDSLLAVTEPDSIDMTQFMEARALRDSLELASMQPLDGTAPGFRLPYFGYELFRNVPEAFEPSPLGPVDDGYLIGPGDELRLTVWGAAEFQYTLPVDAEGRVFIQRVGQITVAGKPLDVLRVDLLRSLSRSYSGLTTDPPTVFMDLTIARLRPIQVFVLGEVSRPGGYTVSSNASAFNVLYSVGGPLQRGSLRKIDIVRNGSRISTLDVYAYLLNGFAENPTRLRTNDFVFVPPRGRTVAVSGAVVRPAYYELAPGETLSDVLDFAGGLTAEAYSKRFQIERIVPISERTDPSLAREVLDLDLMDALSGESEVELQDGDIISIFSISDRMDNVVSIDGAVFQPGRYQLTGDVRTVKDLIARADGLTEEAYRETLVLVRLRDDFTEQQLTLDLQRVLADDPMHNIPLLRRDSIQVFFRSEVQQLGDVTISGHVRRERTLPWRDNMRVNDLLFAGGGLRDSLFLKTVFLERADLFRMSADGLTTRVIPFNLEQTLNGAGLAVEPLQPGDEIRIYPREVELLTADQVTISGAVRNPGEYPYRENLTLEDLVLQAGGFTPSAFLESAEISRDVYGEDQIARTISVPLLPASVDRSEPVEEGVMSALFSARSVVLHPDDIVFVRTDPNLRPQETVLVSGEVRFPGLYTIEHENETLDSVVQRAGGVLPTGYSGGARLIRNGQPVIADFDMILNGRGGRDITVLPGDQVFVPRSPNTVEVRGNVNNPGLIVFENGDRVRTYIDRAGGLAPETADIFVTQADGATLKLRGGLFPTNPRVDEGGIISVTTKPPKEPGDRVDLGNIITETISITGTVLTAIILASRL